MEPIKILYICTPEDRDLRDQLEKHLMILKRVSQITLRLTRDILAGTNWSHEQDERFQRADLILLLVSPNLIASDYHYGIEMRNAIEKHDAGHVWVIPIILLPIHLDPLENTPFGKLQTLPQNGIAITMHANRDAAFVDVVKGISEIVANLLGRKYGFTFSARAGKSSKVTQLTELVCETCRVQNPLATTTCRNCGDLLLTDAEVASLHILGPIADLANGLRCSKCGCENRPGAKFCKQDGQPLNQGAQASRPSAQQSIWAIQTRLAQRWDIVTHLESRDSRASRRWSLDLQRASFYGWQLMSKGEYPAAIASFKQNAVLGQLKCEIVFSLGSAYRELAYSFKLTDQKLYQENLMLAIEQFETTVALKTDVADCYFQLGLSYADLKMYNQAGSAFKNAQQLAPSETAIYFCLGRVAVEQDCFQDALAFFLEGLKREPQHAFMQIALGDLYLKMNQTKSAIDVLRQATQGVPNMWEGWYELGRALMAAEEWKLALSALEQGRQKSLSPALLPATTNFCSAMAQCYLKSNNKISARVMVNEALQGDPNNAEALEVQGQL